MQLGILAKTGEIKNLTCAIYAPSSWGSTACPQLSLEIRFLL